MELIIRNGEYPDFEKGVMIKGDIRIKNGKIVEVGACKEEASMTIDATDKIVSPGFIDIHMHEENFMEEGEQYDVAKRMLQMGVTTCLGGNCGTQNQPLKQFKETLQRLGGAPVNYLMLSGYNTWRNAVGVDRYEKATKAQVEQVLLLLKREIKEGAFGISFGIEYDPGMDEEEILSVLDAFSDKNLFVSVHYRADSDKALASIEEMIRIAEKSQMKFQISHLSSCSAMGMMADALVVINKEMLKNPKLSFDTYPYHAFSTNIGSAVFDEGCFESWGKSYDSLMLTDNPYKNQFCTKEIFYKVRREFPEMLVVAFVMNEDEIVAAIANSGGMVASDAIICHGNGHPRAAGTFPRLLGKYVREEGVISLFDAIRKITAEPAKRLDLHTKGQIKEGYDADITIFDQKTIKDGATFSELNIYPQGIDYVIIDGKIAMDHHRVENERAGKFISYKTI